MFCGTQKIYSKSPRRRHVSSESECFHLKFQISRTALKTQNYYCLYYKTIRQNVCEVITL